MALLEQKVQPDVNALLKVIRRTEMPQRVHHIELFLDEEIKQQLCRRFDLDKQVPADSLFPQLHRDIILHSFLGYDIFCVPLAATAFAIKTIPAPDTTVLADQKRIAREWFDEHTGPIRSWKDFEEYPWPNVTDLDLRCFEWLDKNLPSNMGCYDLTAHILEMATWLLGYETLCLKIYDQPDLVNAIFEKVGNFYTEYTRTLCDFSCIKVIWGSDDMGFRTGTLVAPQFLRDTVLPWHRKCAQIAHANNRPYLLHACGQLADITDDLIDSVGVDARHSYEDAIMPVTEAKKLYGHRMAILGGIDMDFLCRADEHRIRKRVTDTLNICSVNGGYCLGTGNTVANYVPVENYLAMLDQGQRFRL